MPYKLLYKCHTLVCTVHMDCCTDVIQLAVQYIRLAVHYQNIMKQEGIKMSRTRKTYRLSDEAVQVIENRDKSVYPTATDFLEAKLLAPTENTTELLNKVSMQLDEIKLMVAQEHQKKIEEQKAFF
ncbi:MAG: hypothetical protein ACLVJ3_10100 [Coprococcus phoceensis]